MAIWNSKAFGNFINKNWDKLSNQEIANAYGTNIKIVRKYCYANGLFRMNLEYWTAEQVEFLTANYKNIGDKELSILFNAKWKKQKQWTWKHIEKKRLYLQLKRTLSELKRIKARNKLRGCWIGTSTWETRGEAPDSSIAIWLNAGNYYKVIKVKGKWVHYARCLYKQTYGPFPEGLIVGFKDRNNMNVVAENLEAITRGEHAKRNRQFKRKLPAEMQALQQLLFQLNIKIKTKSNEQKH